MLEYRYIWRKTWKNNQNENCVHHSQKDRDAYIYGKRLLHVIHMVYVLIKRYTTIHTKCNSMPNSLSENSLGETAERWLCYEKNQMKKMSMVQALHLFVFFSSLLIFFCSCKKQEERNSVFLFQHSTIMCHTTKLHNSLCFLFFGAPYVSHLFLQCCNIFI